MNRYKRTALIVLAGLILIPVTNIFSQNVDNKNIKIPEYVVPIVVKYKLTNTWFQVNAILVDSEQRLFVSSAYVLHSEGQAWLKISNKWYSAQGWIDFDRALVAFSPNDTTVILPSQVAPLANEDPSRSDSVFVQSYVIKKEEIKENIIPFDTCAISSVITDITIEAYRTDLKLKSIDEHVFYPEHEGAPLIKDGKVVGMILYVSEETYAHATPISGIKDFLKRIQYHVESTENESQ